MNRGIELIFHADANPSKLRMIYFNSFWEAVVDKNGHGYGNDLTEFLHANLYLRKLKVTFIVIGWAWSNMGMPFYVTEL